MPVQRWSLATWLATYTGVYVSLLPGSPLPVKDPSTHILIVYVRCLRAGAFGKLPMTNLPEFLTLLQHGDSFFPSGAFASSWGLETLHADGKVTDTASLTHFITGQLRLRWACCDRPALITAHRAG